MSVRRGSEERAVLTSESSSAITLRVVLHNVKGHAVSDDRNSIVDPPPTRRLSLVGGGSPLAIRDRAKRNNPLVRSDHDLDLTVDDACKYIIKHPNVYQRNARLVEVLRGRIREIPVAVLRERLTSAMTFMGTEKRGSGEKAKLVPKLPSDHVVQAVFHRGDWNARELRGVTDTPIVRDDGTIAQNVGYDADTKFVYNPSAEYPPIEDKPSLDRCQSLLFEKVLPPISHFPWKQHVPGKSAALSAYVSLLLTTMLVSTIRGNIPGFVISANVRGTGKTKLMQIASLIANGYIDNTLAFVEDDDEVRKRIIGELQTGKRVIMFDNVRRRISGDSVDILLTTRRYGDRILGRSENISVDNNSVTVWTGNNLETEGDTVRRVVPIDIESDDPQPEKRKFAFDPVAMAEKDRLEMVVALLTMIRGWYAHGCPRRDDVVMGSYEPWSSIVPQILIWLGITNPLDAIGSSSVVIDRVLQDTIALADVWEGMERILMTDKGITVQQAIELLYPERGQMVRPGTADLRSALESIIDQSGREKVRGALGYRLRIARNRVLDRFGRSFDIEGETHGRQRWSVRARR